MKRSLVVLSLFLLLFLSIFPNSISYRLANPSLEQNERASQNKLFPIQQNGKWGYCDKTGAIVIRPQFELAGEFREGLAPVGVKVARRGGFDLKFGYIDTTGRLVIPAKFKYMAPFSEGLASVEIEGKRGYIDRTGNLVISPQFDEAQAFSNGGAAVKVGAKYGFIDRRGRYIIAPQFSAFYGFSEGLAAVAVGESPNQKYGYIDKSGRFVIRPHFDYAHNFSEGLAVVTVGQYPNNRDGFIDHAGRFVINASFEHARGFSEGLAQVVVDKKWGYIDKTGRYVIQPQFDYAEQFSEGLAAVEIRRSYGYIDRTGRIVIPLQFDRALSFSGGLAQVVFEDKDAYVDPTGKSVWGMRAKPGTASVKEVSPEEQERIVRQMISDRELTAECVEEEGGTRKAVRIELIDLNRDGKQELLISGKQGCTCGARRCYYWIYRRRGNGHELMLSGVVGDSVTPLKISTNGYLDLEVAGPAGNDFVFIRYKFDGARYRERGCEVSAYLGDRRGAAVFSRRRPC
jgi:hypothetical protein